MFLVILDAKPNPLGTSHDKCLVFKIEVTGEMKDRVRAAELAGTIHAKFAALKQINCVIDIHVGVNKQWIVPNGSIYAPDEESRQIALDKVREIDLLIRELHLLHPVSEFYLEMRTMLEEVA